MHLDRNDLEAHLLKSKIDRATVTRADLHYVGSLTLDRNLMDAADLLPGELVHVVDSTTARASKRMCWRRSVLAR